MNTDIKNPNPKDTIGSTKLALSLWPETATILGSLGLLDGALKYGRCNWRVADVRASIYVDAARRHIAAWFEGEDTDPDSGIPHFGHALACIAILIDAEAAGTLIDDRQVHGGYRALLSRMQPHVARLQALHAGKNPKHYSIADNEVGDIPMSVTPTRGLHFGSLDDAPLGVTIDESLLTFPTHKPDHYWQQAGKADWGVL